MTNRTLLHRFRRNLNRRSWLTSDNLMVVKRRPYVLSLWTDGQTGWSTFGAWIELGAAL